MLDMLLASLSTSFYLFGVFYVPAALVIAGICLIASTIRHMGRDFPFRLAVFRALREAALVFLILSGVFALLAAGLVNYLDHAITGN